MLDSYAVDQPALLSKRDDPPWHLVANVRVAIQGCSTYHQRNCDEYYQEIALSERITDAVALLFVMADYEEHPVFFHTLRDSQVTTHYVCQGD